MRDKNGMCIRCKPGDTGEVIGKIVRGNPIKDFVGYVSDAATSKKIVRDVFQKGDVAFASGKTASLYTELRKFIFVDFFRRFTTHG